MLFIPLFFDLLYVSLENMSDFFYYPVADYDHPNRIYNFFDTSPYPRYYNYRVSDFDYDDDFDHDFWSGMPNGKQIYLAMIEREMKRAERLHREIHEQKKLQEEIDKTAVDDSEIPNPEPYKPTYHGTRRDLMIDGISRERIERQKGIGCKYGKCRCPNHSEADHPSNHGKSLNKTKGNKKRSRNEFREMTSHY